MLGWGWGWQCREGTRSGFWGSGFHQGRSRGEFLKGTHPVEIQQPPRPRAWSCFSGRGDPLEKQVWMRTCILGSPPVFGWVFLFAIKGVKRLKKNCHSLCLIFFMVVVLWTKNLGTWKVSFLGLSNWWFTGLNFTLVLTRVNPVLHCFLAINWLLFYLPFFQDLDA